MLFIYKYLPLIFRYPPLFVHMFICSYLGSFRPSRAPIPCVNEKTQILFVFMLLYSYLCSILRNRTYV